MTIGTSSELTPPDEMWARFEELAAALHVLTDDVVVLAEEREWSKWTSPHTMNR